MTEYLAVEDLVRVAQRIVGPGMHVTDYGLLASAAARPQATAFGRDVYPDLTHKVAALLASVIGNHALLDGNKRLGWAAAVVFCDLNGTDLQPPSEDAAFALVMAIAEGTLDVPAIAKELQSWEIWEIETERTLEGMAQSGLFTALDGLLAMRGGPPAPGWRSAHWWRIHDEMANDVRKRIDRDLGRRPEP